MVASPGPLTTQPITETVIGVAMCASRSSSTRTVSITSNCWRAHDGQATTFTPRWRSPSAFSSS